MSECLSTGVCGSSRKENEHRVPIHPRHLDRIGPTARDHLAFEEGYGVPFGVPDEEIAALGFRIRPRNRLLAECDLVLLPKPVAADLRELREGGNLWGWPHCIQQRQLTQIAIDRRLSLLAFESMHLWRDEGKGLHIFYKNNELAGYCGVLHALRLVGRDGHYGPQQSAAVLSFGSVSRGAVYALQGRGFSDLRVYTQRPPHLVADQAPGCSYRRLVRGDRQMLVEAPDGARRPLVEELGEVDVVVNGILQDTEDPIFFLHDDEADLLRPGTLIVDVSCDEGMGFTFARPTTFEEPILEIGSLRYYAVDHTPSYLWNAASWEISEALLPYLDTVMEGPEAWPRDPTLARAVEIRGGVVQNPRILSFQGRDSAYPHPVLGS